MGNIIEEGFLDAAGDDWHSLGLVSKATRKARAEFILESLYKEMEKAGGIEKFLKQHKTELAKNNTERRNKYRKFKQQKETKSREATQKDIRTNLQSSSQ